jgi:hypothetical protein
MPKQKNQKQTGSGGSLGKALIRDKQKKKFELGHGSEVFF